MKGNGVKHSGVMEIYHGGPRPRVRYRHARKVCQGCIHLHGRDYERITHCPKFQRLGLGNHNRASDTMDGRYLYEQEFICRNRRRGRTVPQPTGYRELVL